MCYVEKKGLRIHLCKLCQACVKCKVHWSILLLRSIDVDNRVKVKVQWFIYHSLTATQQRMEDFRPDCQDRKGDRKVRGLSPASVHGNMRLKDVRCSKWWPIIVWFFCFWSQKSVKWPIPNAGQLLTAKQHINHKMTSLVANFKHVNRLEPMARCGPCTECGLRSAVLSLPAN